MADDMTCDRCISLCLRGGGAERNNETQSVNGSNLSNNLQYINVVISLEIFDCYFDLSWEILRRGSRVNLHIHCRLRMGQSQCVVVYNVNKLDRAYFLNKIKNLLSL